MQHGMKEVCVLTQPHVALTMDVCSEMCVLTSESTTQIQMVEPSASGAAYCYLSSMLLLSTVGSCNPVLSICVPEHI